MPKVKTKFSFVGTNVSCKVAIEHMNALAIGHQGCILLCSCGCIMYHAQDTRTIQDLGLLNSDSNNANKVREKKGKGRTGGCSKV